MQNSWYFHVQTNLRKKNSGYNTNTPLPPKNSRIGEEKESNEHVKQQHTTTKAGKKINNVKDHYFT